MEARKPFPLRIDPRLLEVLRKWADDELRSCNAQIEFLLRDAVVRRGRAREEQLGTGEPDGPAGGRDDFRK